MKFQTGQSHKLFKLSQDSSKICLIEQCYLAKSIGSRFIGLMGTDQSRFGAGCGLLLEPCNSIHTFFMKFAIDVFYLKKESAEKYQVVRIVRDKQPWRIDFPVFSANAVLETSSLSKINLVQGDFVCLS